ncbi:hypothetical protein FQA39_LY05413 [Lamprigera yunnana]|nr:hypothetical protein FQA39_LY05413 [Lamprigera yunnana]
MSVKLYMFNGSPPARTALITATAVGVSVDVKVLHKSEELHTPEFLKMNPQHTVPVLDDEGKYLSDSHAIAAYLVGKYGKDDSLYPKDLHQRAVVDQRMYYDAGVMFPVIKSCHTGFWKKEYKQLPQEKIELIKDIYKTLELFIGANKWIAGNNITIADISCSTSISSLDTMHSIDKKVYPKAENWLNRVKSLPYFKVEKTQLHYYKKFVQEIAK